MKVSYISQKYFPHFLLSIITTIGLARAIIAPPMKDTLVSNTIFAQDFQVNDWEDLQGLSLENILSFDEKLDGIIYIVKPGDNLSSIAYKFGTTINQIKQINNLHSDTLRPWQKLIIRSQPGIYYQVKENTTWKDFAQKYKLDLKQLLSLNYVSDENQSLQKGDEIFLPLTQKEAIEKGLLPKPKPKPRPVVYTQPQRTTRTTTSSNTNTTPSSTSRGSKVIKSYYRNPWIYNWFAPGHCTRFVAIKKFPYITDTKQKKLWHGNAKNWYDNAAAAGYPVGQTPKIGSIVVIKYGAPNYYYSYGHVGIVRDIDWKNKKLLIEEMNAKGRFIVTRRRISMDNKIIGYIYYNLDK